MRTFILSSVLLLTACSCAWAEPEPAAVECCAEPSCQPRWWAMGEYMMMWIRNDRAPGPLVTTGPAGVAGAGVIGSNGESVLIDGNLDFHFNSGVRLTIGGWLDADRTFGVEASAFMLETHTIHNKADSDSSGAPVIVRPFFNTQTQQEDAQLITTPSDPQGAQYRGGIDVFDDSRFWGAELNAISNLIDLPNFRLDFLGGFRYFGQKDELRFSYSTTVLPVVNAQQTGLVQGEVGFGGAWAPAPDIVSYRDYYKTLNQFYGGQIGLRGEYTLGALVLGAKAALGIGDTHQELHVIGWTLLTDPTGFTQSLPGALYTHAGNLGDAQRDRFGFIGEWDAWIGWQITDWLRLQASMVFFFWDDTARPGAQIDRNVDPKLIPSNLAYSPTTTNSGPSIRSRDFWAEGFTIGLQVGF